MKKKLTLLLISILLITIYSCKKDKPVDNTEKANFEVKWEHQIYGNGQINIILQPYFSSDYIVYLASFYDVTEDNGMGLIVLDKETGQRHSLWDFEPNITDYFQFNSWTIGGLNNENALALNNKNLICFDINSGQKKWENISSDYYYGNHITSIGKYAYFDHSVNDNAANKTISAVDLETGIEKTVFTSDPLNSTINKLINPVVSLMSNQDTLLIFNMQIFTVNSQQKTDLVAYNLSTDSLEWKVENASSYYTNNIPEVYEDKVILVDETTVNCFDLNNGQLLWKKSYPDESFYLKKNYCFEGKLYTHTDDYNLMCHDIESGNLIWNKSDGAIFIHGEYPQYVAHNNKLYVSTYGDINTEKNKALKCLSTNNGEILWSVGEKNRYPLGGMKIDENTETLYFTTGYSIVAADISE